MTVETSSPGEMKRLIDTAEAQFSRDEGHAIEDVRRHFRDKSTNTNR